MIYFGPFAFETISVEGRVVKYNKSFHNREDMERFCSRLKDFGIGEISVVSGYSMFHVTWKLVCYK